MTSTIERLAEQADMDWQGYALDVIHNWDCSPELEDVINSETGREVERLVAIAFERLADQINEDHAAAIAQTHAEHKAIVAERDKLREALQIIAGFQQCADNTLGDCDIARAALTSAQEKANAVQIEVMSGGA